MSRPSDDVESYKPKPRYSLEELVAAITPENVHPEVDWGPLRSTRPAKPDEVQEKNPDPQARGTRSSTPGDDDFIIHTMD